jgi:hypothetical protein
MENRVVEVEGVPGGKVPVRVLTFVKGGIYDYDEPTVVYTFHCNGQFAARRDEVRLAVLDPRDRYAYFSKVEVTFGWQGARPRNAGKEETVRATTKLLMYVLPLLLREHWPDWRQATGESST